MDFYFGKIGKGNSWGLISETPIVVWLKNAKEESFVSLKSVSEAKKYEEDGSGKHKLYAWNNGIWERVSFVVKSGKPSSAIGFRS
jgi:hypothetical protein